MRVRVEAPKRDVEPYSTATAFLAALRLSDVDRWGADSPPRWYFRGVACASYPLIPTSQRQPRPGSLLRLYWDEAVRAQPDGIKSSARAILENVLMNWGSGRPPTARHRADMLRRSLHVWNQHQAERRALEAFVTFAQRGGWDIPFTPGESLMAFNAPWDVGSGISRYNRFMSRRASDVALIAQHHGVPTRLLDWTANPLIAAYFAASRGEVSAARHASADIAVWAIHEHGFDQTSGPGISRLHCPPSRSDYIRSQEGLFTQDLGADYTFIRRGYWRTHDTGIPNDLVRKMLLPRAQAAELLHLLFREGYSPARVMPTMDNVTQTIHVRARLDAKRAGN